jgi:hypothetical protein
VEITIGSQKFTKNIRNNFNINYRDLGNRFTYFLDKNFNTIENENSKLDIMTISLFAVLISILLWILPIKRFFLLF